MLRKLKPSAGFLLVVLGLSFVFPARSQPIAPTSDLKSQTATPSVVDLPYKPEDPTPNPPQDPAANPDTPSEAAPDVATKPVFDWNNLPYIPLKMLVLPSLPDPDF